MSVCLKMNASVSLETVVANYNAKQHINQLVRAACRLQHPMLVSTYSELFSTEHDSAFADQPVGS